VGDKPTLKLYKLVDLRLCCLRIVAYVSCNDRSVRAWSKLVFCFSRRDVAFVFVSETFIHIFIFSRPLAYDSSRAVKTMRKAAKLASVVL